MTIDVAADKPAAYANCHCSQCRRMGKPFGSWAVFPADKVTVHYADGKGKEGKVRHVWLNDCCVGCCCECVMWVVV